MNLSIKTDKTRTRQAQDIEALELILYQDRRDKHLILKHWYEFLYQDGQDKHSILKNWNEFFIPRQTRQAEYVKAWNEFWYQDRQDKHNIVKIWVEGRRKEEDQVTQNMEKKSLGRKVKCWSTINGVCERNKRAEMPKFRRCVSLHVNTPACQYPCMPIPLHVNTTACQLSKRQLRDSLQGSIYIMNSVDKIQLSQLVYPRPTNYHSLFRNLPPLFVLYLVKRVLIKELRNPHFWRWGDKMRLSQK